MNTATYANRKRKKPQKSVKTVTATDGAKSNPSKRHRERLNGELERLADLLPFPRDVVSKLDKLTVLRLSVSYLRAKSHLSVSLKSANVQHPEGNGLKKQGVDLLEGELLLRVLNGFVLVVTAGGNIFYASSTIQDYLGFHQSDVIHQRVFEFVHSDDRAEFQRQLHWALKSPSSPDAASDDSTSPQTYDNPELLPPENSTFLDRNFVCRLRCLLDNSSGFTNKHMELWAEEHQTEGAEFPFEMFFEVSPGRRKDPALNFQGRLKSLHGQNEKGRDGKPGPPQLALFALASPLQAPSILEIRTKNFVFRTKHKLDFTPLACDAKGQMMLGYTEEELCYRGSGYQFIHAADMLHCAENHMRMMKTGESGMTVFRLLTKQNGWMWVRANARLIYKNGRPEFIVASQRVVTNEEGDEHLRKRTLQVPFSYTTGEAVLYESILPSALGGPEAPGSHDNGDDVLNPDSLLGSLMKQDKSIYLGVQSKLSLPLQEDDCGGIFSSSWQEGILSLPDSSLFKHKSQDDQAEDRDADLWSFMRNMGIGREDFELFRRDETFVNVEVDGRDTLPDLTDGILCFVQESLRKRSDCAFVDVARLPGDPVPSGAPSVLQHQPPKLQHDQPPVASLWQPLPAEQQSHLHPQSLQLQPLAPILQHCLHAQPDAQMQAPPHRGHRFAQQPPAPPQLSPLNGQAATHQHHQQQQQEQQQQQQREPGDLLLPQPGRPDASLQYLSNNGQNIPTLFHVDQSDVQRRSLPQHGCVSYPEAPAQALPFKNQFHAASVNCAQGLAYAPTARPQSQSATAVIGPRVEGPRFGGPELRGVAGVPAWPVESLRPPQRLVADPRSVDTDFSLRLVADPRSVDTDFSLHLVADPRSVDTDFSLHPRAMDQPHTTPFQNCSHGNDTGAGHGPRRKGDFGHSEPTKREQPPSPGAN